MASGEAVLTDDSLVEARRFYDPSRGVGVIGSAAMAEFMASGGEQEKLKELDSTNYYYDLLSMRLLVGDKAVDEHYETGGHNAEIYVLAELISDRKLAISLPQKPAFKRAGVSREQCLDYGRWLQGVLQAKNSSAVLQHEDIERANMLGIGPSYSQIVYRFGDRINEFYESIGRDIPRRGYFDNWGVRKLISNRREIIEEIGGQPTEDELAEMAKDGKEAPSTWVIRQKIGSTRALYELMGQGNFANLEPEDYLDWGIKYKLANQGITPTGEVLRRLSPLKIAPPQDAVAEAFGSLVTFREEINRLYAARMEERKDKIKKIRNAMRLGVVSAEAVNGARTDDEILKQFGKYRILHDRSLPILNNLDEQTKIELCISKNDLEFIIELIEIHEKAEATNIPEVVSTLLLMRKRLYLDDFMTTLKDEAIAA